ncbi:Protein PTST, chloroplastic [Linum perenne]
MGFAGCCMGKQVPWFSWSSHTLYMESVHKLPCNIDWGMKTKQPVCKRPHLYSTVKHRKSQVSWRTFIVAVSLKESSSYEPEDYFGDERSASEDSSEEQFDKPLASDQLRSLLADSERAKLVKKLGEANQQNRFLKRQYIVLCGLNIMRPKYQFSFFTLQMMVNEETLISFKTELAVMELETKALVALAEEIAQAGIPKGSRKINGKYIQSHLLSRLQVLREKLGGQIKDVVAAQSKEISLFWVGMAESVQVMGSFDGWSQGTHLSPDYNGTFTKFTTTIMLRPGRYEIKFMVDGEWKLSPEYPTVGEGLTQNNLLVIE